MKANKVIPVLIGGSLLCAAALYSKEVRNYLFSYVKAMKTKIIDLIPS